MGLFLTLGLDTRTAMPYAGVKSKNEGEPMNNLTEQQIEIVNEWDLSITFVNGGDIYCRQLRTMREYVIDPAGEMWQIKYQSVLGPRPVTDRRGV